ncbi:hypothetical protein [Bradyrhizobium erythrophlei]|uniref:hypothetical protein n=1 Tax=Bradyrhizobium erythrophlei TaxID=1437360 RepID=UPI00115FC851|nr:hypothetical protein [Bradyrhizobium erythrophlei]
MTSDIIESGTIARDIASEPHAIIASEAKQSIAPPMRMDGLLRRFAPRNDEAHIQGHACSPRLRTFSMKQQP